MVAVGESTAGQDAVIRVLQEVEVNTFTVSNSDGNARSSSDRGSRTSIGGSTRNSDGESLCGTEEAAWIKDRLVRKRAAAREAGSRRHQHHQQNLPHDSRGDRVEGLGTLQLRRVLRAVGLPTDGLQELLAKRMREAVATGRLASFVEEQRAIPRESFQCVVHMRRKASMLALVESLIAAFPGPNNSHPTAPARAESYNNDPDEDVTSPSSGSVPEIAQPASEGEQSPPPSNPSSPIATAPRFEAIDSPSTPATLPATPAPRTPETPTVTTGAPFSKIAQEPPASGPVGQPSSPPPEELQDVSASPTVTSGAALDGDASAVDGAQQRLPSTQVDATARMKDGRGRPRTKQVMWGLPFAKKSTEKAPISGSAPTVQEGQKGLLMDKAPRPKTTTTTSRWRRVVGGRSWVRRGPPTCTVDDDTDDDTVDDADTDADAADVASTTPVTCSAFLETASASKNSSTTTTTVTSALGLSSLLRPSRFVSRSPSPQRKKGMDSPDESSPSKIRSRSPSPSRKGGSPLTSTNAAATETTAAIKTTVPEQTLSSSTVGATSQRHKDATVPTPAAAADVASHSSDPDAKPSVMSTPTITAGAPPNQGAITIESSSGHTGAAEGAPSGGIGYSSINDIATTPKSTPRRDATPAKPPQPVTTPAVKLLPPGAMWGSRTAALSTEMKTTHGAAVAEELKKTPPRRVEPNLAPSPTGGGVSLEETTCVSAERNGHQESQGAEPVRAIGGEKGIVGTHPADAQSQMARQNLEKKLAAMTTTSTTSTKPPRTPTTATTAESTTSPSAKAPSIAVLPYSSSATPGASSRAVGPPPVPPRPIAPPVPPRTAVAKMAATVVNVKSTVAAPPRQRPSPVSPSTTAAASSTNPTNPLLPPVAVSGAMAVRSQAAIAPPSAAYVGSNSSGKSVRRPGLASGGVGLQRSGGTGAGPRAPLSGGVGVNRSGMTRAVSPSRLPAPIDDDDEDDSSDYIINTSKPIAKDNNKPGDFSQSKVLKPLKPSAAVVSSQKIQAHHNKHHNTHHNKHQQQGAHQHQQPHLEKQKPFRSKNIEVIFGDDGDGEEEGDDGGNDDSDSEDEHEYSIRPDSDSGSDDENDPALRILEPTVTPEWAKPEAVAAALERQYGGDKPINPSTIFVDFYTCSLENIFDTKKKKWDRKSTGDWMTDRLTIAEKMAYDRAMGYVTIGAIGNNNNKAGSSGRNKPSSRADERLRT